MRLTLKSEKPALLNAETEWNSPNHNALFGGISKEKRTESTIKPINSIMIIDAKTISEILLNR